MRVLLLEDVLLAAEVMVEDGLLLEVVEHLVADLVRLTDPLVYRPVPRRELVERRDLVLQVARLKDELVLLRVLHQQLQHRRQAREPEPVSPVLTRRVVHSPENALTLRLACVSAMMLSRRSIPKAFSKARTLSM